jgi:hypothetical protein
MMVRKPHRARDMRRREAIVSILRRLGEALNEWLEEPETFWIELGAIEPPRLSDAAGAVRLKALLAADGLDRALEGDLRGFDPDTIVADFMAAYHRLGDELLKHLRAAITGEAA